VIIWLGFFPPLAFYAFRKNIFLMYSTYISYDFLQGNEY
jgi:hypothetical protein